MQLLVSKNQWIILYQTKERLDTFAFVDNIGICGRTENDHDENLVKFQEPVRHLNLTFNKDKYKFLTTS